MRTELEARARRRKKKENVVMGTMLLGISSLVVRMVGFLFRIYLSNALGAEGMGVYSLILSLYALCTTIATSGISVAVSKIVAEQIAAGKHANAKRVLRRAVTLSLGISLAVGVVVFAFSDMIAMQILKESRTALSLRLLAPGMPFLAVSAVIRGYFIACRRMSNPASGQVVEQLFKMAFIALLMGSVLPLGIEYGCALVVLGMTLGEAVCLLWTAGGYLRYRRRERIGGKADIRGATRSILRIAMPISLGSYIRSALRLVEDILIVSGLRAFSGAVDVATGTYGILRGMAMPLLIFPLNLLSSFVTTLTPEISRLNARENPRRMESAIAMVLRYTCIIGIFIVGIFMTFSYELGTVIYKDAQVGEILRQMAFLVPFMCIEMVVVGILQGLDEQLSSMRYGVGDCLLRIVLVYLLIPVFGVGGFMVMVIASNLFTSLLNLRRLVKITKIHLQWREWLFQPLLATLAAGQIGRCLYHYLFAGLAMWQGLLLGSVLMGCIYFVALVGIGALRAGDLTWITGRIRLSTKQPGTVEKAEI